MDGRRRCPTVQTLVTTEDPGQIRGFSHVLGSFASGNVVLRNMRR